MTENYLFIVVVFMFIFWILAIAVSGDLFSPVSLFTLMFFFSTVFAYYSKNIWGFILTKDTFVILIIGILTFLVTSFLVQGWYLKKRKYRICNLSVYNPTPVKINVTYTRALLLACIFILLGVIYIFLVAKTVGGFSSLSSLAASYRRIITTNSGQLPFVGRLALIVMRAMSTTIVCIIINNFFSHSLKENHGWILGFCVIGYVLLTLFSGERTSTLRVLGMLVLCFSIYWQRSNQYRRLISIRYIIMATFGAISALYGFSAIRYFVGRSSQLNILDYIALYAGGPIYNFNRFIEGFSAPTGKGTNTFVGLLNNLARLGIGEGKSIHRDVVVIESRGLYLGNVYTCFYDYYLDFGIIGMILLVILYAFIINRLYFRAKYTYNQSVLCSAKYIFVGSTLFFVSFTEQFFSTYVTISTIEFLVAMYFTYYFLTAKRIGKLKFRLLQY